MNRMTAWMLFAGLAITSVGCTASGTALTRGQSPEHAYPTGQYQHDGGMVMHDGGMMQGGMPMHGGMMHGGMPMHGGMGPDGCWHGPCVGMGACNGNGMNPNDYQGHTLHYTHCMPKNLKYPNPDVPPTVVQYPYYTVKGPSDFFMK